MAKFMHKDLHNIQPEILVKEIEENKESSPLKAPSEVEVEVLDDQL